jgi:Protein of unknown function (DUF1176)
MGLELPIAAIKCLKANRPKRNDSHNAMKLSRFLKISLMLCFLESLSPVPSAAEQLQRQSFLREFRDWIVGCDNTRSCHATNLPLTPTFEGNQSYSDGPSLGRVQMSIKWDDTASCAQASIKISVKALFPDERPIGPITALKVDQELLGIPIRFEGEQVILPPCGDKAVLDGVLNGTTLSLLDQNGVAAAGVSLRGLKDAVDYVAEQKAASHLKPPKSGVIYAIPRHNAPPAQLNRKALNTLRPINLCGISALNQQVPPASFHRLDANTSLAIIPPVCNLESSNFHHRIVLYNNSRKLLPLEFDSKPDELPSDLLSNARWNSDTLRLETTTHHRMLGDCGIAQSYAWDGRRFRLVETSEMSVCRGSRVLITTWRASHEIRAKKL